MLWRVTELFFLFLDRSGIAWLYDTLSYRLKRSARKLTDLEITVGRSVYGDSIDYTKVNIDEKAYLGPKQYRLCYVSFNTINSWGKMSDELLVHELMHIWQYQHFGAVYIPRALWAQRTKEGYNYGGLDGLITAWKADQKIWEFNYEQQGDIVSDYYRLLIGKTPCWGNATFEDIDLYVHFVDQLKTPPSHSRKK